MCKTCNFRHPLQCIIPPYMVDKLIKNKDEKISKLGLVNKIESSKLRYERSLIQSLDKKSKQSIKTIVARSAAPTASPRIDIYDSEHTKARQWTRINNPASSADADVRRAYQGSKITWDLYFNIFNRNSIDNAGMRMIHNVNFGVKYANAFWDGTQMTYGDGDGIVFTSFTQDIDIIAHELTHGVIEHTCALDYENQSGALNESCADVFGILVKQYNTNTRAKSSNWLIGMKVVKGAAYALRSMKEPGKAYRNHPFLGNDPQPAVMSDFKNLPNTEEGDWGGVHINSGIPNFAFYVTSFNLGGYAWEKAGKIWYAAINDKTLQTKAKFTDMKRVTIAAAIKLFGTGSLEEKAVRDGWKAAEV